MWLSEATWILSIHMPHVCSISTIFNWQVLFRIYFKSVISIWMFRRWNALPIVGYVDDEIVTSCIIGFLIFERSMICIIIKHTWDGGISIILICLHGNNWEYSIPAWCWNLSLIISFNSKVKISIFSWNIDRIRLKGAWITNLVVPIVSVTFIVSILSNLEVIHTRQEISSIHKHYTIGIGCGGVDTVGDLGLESTSPTGIIMFPSTVVIGDSPWISNHVHFV